MKVTTGRRIGAILLAPLCATSQILGQSTPTLPDAPGGGVAASEVLKVDVSPESVRTVAPGDEVHFIASISNTAKMNVAVCWSCLDQKGFLTVEVRTGDGTVVPVRVPPGSLRFNYRFTPESDIVVLPTGSTLDLELIVDALALPLSKSCHRLTVRARYWCSPSVASVWLQPIPLAAGEVLSNPTTLLLDARSSLSRFLSGECEFGEE
jgi:hypothetical protein